MTDDVLVTIGPRGGYDRVFHTDSDRPHIRESDRVVEKARSVLNDARICAKCSGEYRPHDTGATGPFRRLQEMSVAEFEEAL